LCVHIYLHMQDAPDFEAVPRIIGKRGSNTKGIAAKTGAKIRIRGRGSGHLEMEGKSEAPTPLMVAVTSDHRDADGFRAAVGEIVQALESVAQRFGAHCQKAGHVHEGPCYSVGAVHKEAREALGALLARIPQMDPRGQREL